MKEEMIILIIIAAGVASLASFFAACTALVRSRTHKPSELRVSEPIRKIPIVSSIAAGLGVIVEDNIVEYLWLDDNQSKGADFGVRVVGDSMKGRGILPGDIALIRRQPGVEMGQIAAVVITTPVGSDGVLKQYYHAYEDRADMWHWFLESSNPTSEHLVVIPGGANADAIKALYEQAVRSGKIRNPIKYYEDAELTIAGEYVGLVRGEIRAANAYLSEEVFPTLQ